jgi:membrane-associated protease RseP (regulator of RpoE activity)
MPYKIFSTEYLGELFLLIIVAFILLYHLSILIHEIGHALTLNILKFKVKIFKVGPIKYINNADKGKIVFNKNGLFLGGGYVRHMKKNNKSKILVYFVSGKEVGSADAA